MNAEQKAAASEIIRRAEEILQTARHGLDDFRNANGPRRYSGLRNFVVFGRSVTFVLQNISGKVDGFAEWYAPHQETMRADAAMRYFVELRNEILKKGKTSVAQETVVHHLDDDVIRKLGTPPPGATDLFIGDEFGGAGWVVPLPDGTETKYYLELPRSVAEFRSVFMDVPESARAAIGGRSAEDLADEYFAKLVAIVDHCRAHFLGAPAQVVAGRRLPPYLRVVK